MNQPLSRNSLRHPTRRQILQVAGASSLTASTPWALPAVPGPKPHGEIYRRLGIKTVINAKGFYTRIGGSIMPREVREAMEDAAHHFVDIHDLHRAVGGRLAEITEAGAALVTAGASAAITLGTAGCMTGVDRGKIRRLPQTGGMKDEVIIQKRHRNVFDHAVRATGAKLVTVETMEQYQAAFNERTAMVYHLVADRHWGPRISGQISLRDAIDVAHEHSVPYLVDAAAEAPPASNLTFFTGAGADLVCFSGGKGLMGPQCSGLLTGHRDLVEAAWLNFMGISDTIGRSMKVGKEEIAGLLAAVERFVALDHDEIERQWTARLHRVAAHFHDLKGIEAELLPEDIEPPHVPRLYVKWDEQAAGLTTEEAIQQLRDGDPPIHVNHSYYGLTIVPALMKPEEEEIVGRRLRAVLEPALKRV